MVGCGKRKQPVKDLITVDIAENYPRKEFILQDLMDVEYIVLETRDEFITQGFLRAAPVTKPC